MYVCSYVGIWEVLFGEPMAVHFLAANFVFSLRFLLVVSVLSRSNEQREKKCGCSEESHVKEALTRICEGGRAFLLSFFSVSQWLDRFRPVGPEGCFLPSTTNAWL